MHLLFAFGLTFSVAASWVGAYIVFSRIPRDLAHSISWHSSRTPQTFRIFEAVLSLNAIIFSAALIVAIGPRLHLPNQVITFGLFACLAEFVTAHIPDHEGKSHAYHNLFAYSMSIFMLGMCLTTALADLNPMLRVAGALTATYMTVAIGLLALTKLLDSKYLVYQSIYILSFEVFVLLLAWLPN